MTDFGLAKRGDGADLTRTEAVMGTPAYTSPEQARGRAKFVGPPADAWALGVMLYEAVAGVRPFAGGDPWSLLHAVAAAEPTGLRAAAPGTPRDLHLICHKCLAREPHERYATAAELAADLRAWRAGRPVAARPLGAARRAAKWVRRNQRVAGAAAAVFLALAGGAGVATWQWRRAERALTLATDRELETLAALAESEMRGAERWLRTDRNAETLTHCQSAVNYWTRLTEAKPSETHYAVGLARALVARAESLSVIDGRKIECGQSLAAGTKLWEEFAGRHPGEASEVFADRGREFADRAITLLRDAVESGVIAYPEFISQEPGFEPLYDRRDFRALMTKLRTKHGRNEPVPSPGPAG